MLYVEPLRGTDHWSRVYVSRRRPVLSVAHLLLPAIGERDSDASPELVSSVVYAVLGKEFGLGDPIAKVVKEGVAFAGLLDLRRERWRRASGNTQRGRTRRTYRLEGLMCSE